MAYDEGLAQRLREIYADVAEVSERKMFGGLAFLVNGHMTCGIVADTLMARVGPQAYEAALARAHVRPMDFTGKPLNGFVYVEPAGIELDDELAAWVALSLAFVASLPPK